MNTFNHSIKKNELVRLIIANLDVYELSISESLPRKFAQIYVDSYLHRILLIIMFGNYFQKCRSKCLKHDKGFMISNNLLQGP